MPIEDNSIKRTFVKINDVWVPLLGADINSVLNIDSESNILNGTTDPTADVGNDGDIYLKHNATPTLPAGLTALSYIESTGTQYINTGYLIKPNTKVEISMQIKNVQPNINATLFGARAYGYGMAGSPDAWAVGNRYVFGVQMGALYREYGSVYDYNTDIVFTAQSGIAGAWTGNGINKSYTINSSLGTGAYPLHLFTCYDHAYGHIGDMCSCLRLYYAKFYEGDELVRVYIPVSDSDGIPCLWEALSGQIYRNGGTGDFSAGTELRGTITAAYAKVNGAWQPLVGTDINNINIDKTTISDNDLLFHFNENYENSGKTPAIMSNITGYELSTEQSKFGNTSLKIASAPNYSIGAIHMPYDFSLGSEDFTIDFWMYQTSSSTNASCAFSFNYRSLAYYSKTATKRGLTVAKTSSAWTVDHSESNESLNIMNGWHHVAITRENGTIRVFVDGIQEDSFSFANSFPIMSKLSFGTNSTGDTSWRGYIDEFRLKIGKAEWTENFTPPDTPYV